MKCYKCHEEMYPMCDTAWRTHKDGTRERNTEFLCAECKIWIEIKAYEYDLEDEEI